MGWATDYPYAGINLLTRVAGAHQDPGERRPARRAELLGGSSDRRRAVQVPVHDGHRRRHRGVLDAKRRTALREYLLKGGFLWVDDFWGTLAWEQWSCADAAGCCRSTRSSTCRPITRSVTRCSTLAADPAGDEHQLLAAQRRRRRRSAAPTARTPNFRMIADAQGRIMVLMTHNTDIGDSWEREGEDREFFLQFSPDGYALGINVVLYNLTH